MADIINALPDVVRLIPFVFRAIVAIASGNGWIVWEDGSVTP